MGEATDTLRALRPRLASRAGPPSCDEVAGQLFTAMGAVIDAERLASNSLEAAEYSDSHGRMRAMAGVRDELESAAAALERAGVRLLASYFE